MSDKQKDWGHFADGKVHLICSSHNDIAWFDTPAATITWRDVRSITPALDRMAEHDDVKFAMENEDGTMTDLLSVPNYSYAWQPTYELE